MKYVTIGEILYLHEKLINKFGGTYGLRDAGLLESSLAQPRMTFDGKELYVTISEKAGVLGFSLIKNHSFIDGNKRIGHAAIELFLLKNGYEIICDVDEQEEIIMSIAGSKMGKEDFINWLNKMIIKIG